MTGRHCATDHNFANHSTHLIARAASDALLSGHHWNHRTLGNADFRSKLWAANRWCIPDRETRIALTTAASARAIRRKGYDSEGETWPGSLSVRVRLGRVVDGRVVPSIWGMSELTTPAERGYWWSENRGELVTT